MLHCAGSCVALPFKGGHPRRPGSGIAGMGLPPDEVPVIARRDGSRTRAPALLLEDVGEGADAVDGDLDRVARLLHGTHAERRAAGDDIAGQQGHIV